MDSTEWETIGAATVDEREYVFTDALAPTGRVAYRLRYSTAAGTVYTPESWVTVPGAHTLSLAGFAPNPSKGHETTIAFALPGNERADLRVYDAAGREVFGREVGSLGPGRHRLRIAPATLLSPGIYWVQLGHGDRLLRSKGLVLQ